MLMRNGSSDRSSETLRDRTVLIVEDEYMIASELAAALRAAGAEVAGPVPTVERALDMIGSEFGIDAAILDVNLRETAAYPVADALRAAGVPFVLMTGYDDRSIPERLTGVPRCRKPIPAGEAVRFLAERGLAV